MEQDQKKNIFRIWELVYTSQSCSHITNLYPICYFFQNLLNEFIGNYNSLPMLILKYCIAVPEPQKLYSPDSHKNLVKISSLVRLYVMVLDWFPASEWRGVWDNLVKLGSFFFWIHHPIVWNHIEFSFKCAKKIKKSSSLIMYCDDTYFVRVTTNLSLTSYL